VPGSVRTQLESGALETSKPGDPRDVGKVHAALARSIALGRSSFEKPCVILSDGETTVTVRP